MGILGSGLIGFGGVGGGGLFSSHALRTYQQPAGTSGGAVTAGDWRTYPLNTDDYDPDEIAPLASNQLTLQAGSYRALIWGCVLVANGSRLRLRDVTNGLTLVVSNPGYWPSDPGLLLHLGIGFFTLSAEVVLEMQVRVAGNTSGFGLGINPDWGESGIFGGVLLGLES